MQEYTTADVDSLAIGSQNNPDGFGYAVHAGTHIVKGSGLNFDAVLDNFLKTRAIHSGPALFHSRITTHGGTNINNCHPFQVGKDTNTVVAHNGMLPIAARNGMSDTAIFAKELFPSWGGASTLNSKKTRKKLSKFADGSKLVFLSTNPDVQEDYYIINEDLGHWNEGVWWSNNSYKYDRYSYAGSGMYTSGWSSTSKTPKDMRYEVDMDNYKHDMWDEQSLLVEDCTYIDTDGNEVWGELWRCANCDHIEYINEANVNNADLCLQCDSCWFCSEPRMLCMCMGAQSDIVDDYNNGKLYLPAHSMSNYDSTYDYF
jgi:glutamine amidotransferase